MEKLNDLKTLYLHEIKDLYDAEHRITEALPKMAERATDENLKKAFRSHLEETRGQIERLEQVFEKLGQKAERTPCKAMQGLIAEGEEILKAKGEPEVIDAGLIGAAQRVEHYEMAGYGTARNLAKRLGHDDQAELLETTLSEEKEADSKLTRVAIREVNVEAAHA